MEEEVGTLNGNDQLTAAITDLWIGWTKIKPTLKIP